MATVTLNMTPAEWAAYMLRLGRNYMPAALRGVRSGAMRCVGIVQRRTDFAPPASGYDGRAIGAVDTGAYKAAWQTTPLPNGAQLHNSRPYAAVIEHGRRPAPVGKAGIQNLEQWAHRKLKLSGDAATSAAYAIAKTLHERPLRERSVMTGGLDAMETAARDEVQRELEKELTRK